MNRLLSAGRRRLDPDALLRAWRSLALSGTWRVASDWLCPEVLGLVRAASRIDSEQGAGIRSEVRALGHARAAQGVSAAEAVADLFAFFEAVNLSPSGPLTAAFAEAWAVLSADWAPTASCVEPAMGFATWGHLRARLYEVYTEEAPVPGDRIIAMVRLPSGTPALATDAKGSRIDVEPLPASAGGVGHLLDSLHR